MIGNPGSMPDTRFRQCLALSVLAVAVVFVTAPRPAVAQDLEQWKKAADAQSGCRLFAYPSQKEDCVSVEKDIRDVESTSSSCYGENSPSPMTKDEAQRRIDIATKKYDFQDKYYRLHERAYDSYGQEKDEIKQYADTLRDTISRQMSIIKDKMRDYQINIDSCKKGQG